MKKFVAIALSLLVVLAMVSIAAAETRTYMLISASDLDGKDLPNDQLPALMFTLNDKTMECSFGVENEPMFGTAKKTTKDGITVVEITMDKVVLVLEYISEGDCYRFIDEENGVIFYLAQMDAK